MEERNDIVIYKSEDGLVTMEAMVDPAGETIWASQKAMSELFGVNPQAITRHLGNIYEEGELKKEATCSKMEHVRQEGSRTVTRQIEFYNLDAIISVGYRINSRRATAFRIWSTQVLKQYMIKGYVVNRNVVSEQKYEDLKKAVGLLENVFSKELLLTSEQAVDLFDVIRDYTYALDTLDAYDYQSLKIADTTAPERFHATYENAMAAINSLKEKFGASELFGVEKDASFHSSIGKFSSITDNACGHGTTHALIGIDGDNKVLIGFITLRASSFITMQDDVAHGEAALEIMELAIDKRYEHNGYGETLIDYAIAIADDMNDYVLGTKYIVLCADEQAVPFYEKTGFEKLSNYGQIPRNGANDQCVPMIMRIRS